MSAHSELGPEAIPPHVLAWLRTITPKDVALFDDTRDFVAWALTTKKYATRFTGFLLVVFAGMAAWSRGIPEFVEWLNGILGG